jgi:hypothetical protein
MMSDRADLHQIFRPEHLVIALTEIKEPATVFAHCSTMVEQSLLLTDLHQLSMLEAYAAHGMIATAVFEQFFRKPPPERGFLLTAGLRQAGAFLAGLRFAPDELAWLTTSGRFSPAFVEDPACFRFIGDVDAMPEGTVIFADEPVLRVTAPLPQAHPSDGLRRLTPGDVRVEISQGIRQMAARLDQETARGRSS